MIDGEIAVLNEKGLSHFSSLQNWRSEADGELIYYVFDILWLDGNDLNALAINKETGIIDVNNLPEMRLSG